jgi:hypothetical protein
VEIFFEAGLWCDLGALCMERRLGMSQRRFNRVSTLRRKVAWHWQSCGIYLTIDICSCASLQTTVTQTGLDWQPLCNVYVRGSKFVTLGVFIQQHWLKLKHQLGQCQPAVRKSSNPSLTMKATQLPWPEHDTHHIFLHPRCQTLKPQGKRP